MIFYKMGSEKKADPPLPAYTGEPRGSAFFCLTAINWYRIIKYEFHCHWTGFQTGILQNKRKKMEKQANILCKLLYGQKIQKKLDKFVQIVYINI